MAAGNILVGAFQQSTILFYRELLRVGSAPSCERRWLSRCQMVWLKGLLPPGPRTEHPNPPDRAAQLEIKDACVNSIGAGKAGF
jgi:hypothetical protein